MVSGAELPAEEPSIEAPRGLAIGNGYPEVDEVARHGAQVRGRYIRSATRSFTPLGAWLARMNQGMKRPVIVERLSRSYAWRAPATHCSALIMPGGTGVFS